MRASELGIEQLAFEIFGVVIANIGACEIVIAHAGTRFLRHAANEEIRPLQLVFIPLQGNGTQPVQHDIVLVGLKIIVCAHFQLVGDQQAFLLDTHATARVTVEATYQHDAELGLAVQIKAATAAELQAKVRRCLLTLQEVQRRIHEAAAYRLQMGRREI